MADNPRKRKQPIVPALDSKRPRFPPKAQHRVGVTSTSSAYPHGEINVGSFLKAHQNEIKSLEHAVRVAKKGLTRRAFQQVPREMRRRTASHNPQRVPNRIRAQARQEARDDNTPVSKGKSGTGIGKGKSKFLRKEGMERSRKAWETRAKQRRVTKQDGTKTKVDENGSMQMDAAATKSGKEAGKQKKRPKFPALAVPATPPSKFRRRQQDKTWLPTHVWHAKRAHMSDPKNPLWRFAVPVKSTTKDYRLVHRAASQRGVVAWDMSYMSTLSLEGTESAIIGILKGLHFASGDKEDPWQGNSRAKKWIAGTRTWDGWICQREGTLPKRIAQVTVIWCVPATESNKRKVFIRLHPSAFLQLWNPLIRVAKVQRPAVTVCDLRFQIGSIELVGPATTETLCSILSPVTTQMMPDTPQAVWPLLASVTSPGSLPSGALLAFDISDPRLRDPPAASPILQDQADFDALLETIALWPPDQSQQASSLFDGNARLAAARLMSSQKSINSRKSKCTMGETPEVRPTDPEIPTLVYTSRDVQCWTILLPWKCILPVWRGISRYPLSTGGAPRFGGLTERRQVNYEASVPFFPYDHPGTSAGWDWECREREVRKHEWTKRPKGKRIEWSTIDLKNGKKGEVGDPWSNAWELLFPAKLDSTAACTKDETPPHPEFHQLSSHQASCFLGGKTPSAGFLTTAYTFTVKVKMITRGGFTDCARVYRLPKRGSESRRKWLSHVPRLGPRTSTERQGQHSADKTSQQIRNRQLAQALLTLQASKAGPPQPGEEAYPAAFNDDDLIGFVTTGNYNLVEGGPSAIANLALHRILSAEVPDGGVTKEDQICIVRQVGSTIGRLGRWEVA